LSYPGNICISSKKYYFSFVRNAKITTEIIYAVKDNKI
jgi:hypothetical protein